MAATAGRGGRDGPMLSQNQTDTSLFVMGFVMRLTCRCRKSVRGIDSTSEQPSDDILKKQPLVVRVPRGTKFAFHPVERFRRRSADPKRGSARPAVASGTALADPDVQHPEVLVMTNYISLRAVWHALKERGYWRMCAAMSTDHPVPVSPNRRCL